MPRAEAGSTAGSSGDAMTGPLHLARSSGKGTLTRRKSRATVDWGDSTGVFGMKGILGPRWSALAGLSHIVMVMAPLSALAQSTNLLAGGDSVFVTYDNGSHG